MVLYKILAYGLILFLVIKNVERHDQARNMISRNLSDNRYSGLDPISSTGQDRVAQWVMMSFTAYCLSRLLARERETDTGIPLLSSSA